MNGWGNEWVNKSSTLPGSIHFPYWWGKQDIYFFCSYIELEVVITKIQSDPNHLKKCNVAKSRTRLSDFTFTFHFHALEKEMATHSSVLAWRRIPGTGEPGGLPSVGSHRVGHDWSHLAVAVASIPGVWARISHTCGGIQRAELPRARPLMGLVQISSPVEHSVTRVGEEATLRWAIKQRPPGPPLGLVHVSSRWS